MAIDESGRVDDIRFGKIGGWIWQRHTGAVGGCVRYPAPNCYKRGFDQIWPQFSMMIVADEWNALTQAEKDVYNNQAKGKPLLGINLFVKEYWAAHKVEVEEAGKQFALYAAIG